MEKILIIDDCPEVALLAKNALSQYDVYAATSIKEAQDIVGRVHFALFVIDVNLPDGSGFDFCQELSNLSQFADTPKLFLSGETSTAQKVYGFSCGADDYVTKPFAQQELAARVGAKLRTKKGSSQEIQYGLKFDYDFQRCFSLENDEFRDLQLTPTEFRLLSVLVKKANRPLERRELVRAIWNFSGINVELRGIDSHISHIRKKMGARGRDIQSVYGQGYAFRAPDVEAQKTS